MKWEWNIFVEKWEKTAKQLFLDVVFFFYFGLNFDTGASDFNEILGLIRR